MAAEPDNPTARPLEPAPARGLGGFLFRRGLLLFSCACVLLACVVIAAAFRQERSFRLGTQGLVRSAVYPEAPFGSFDELQQHVRALGREHGWSVIPRRGEPLEVSTNWFGDRELRVLLDELRVAPRSTP